LGVGGWSRGAFGVWVGRGGGKQLTSHPKSTTKHNPKKNPQQKKIKIPLPHNSNTYKNTKHKTTTKLKNHAIHTTPSTNPLYNKQLTPNTKNKPTKPHKKHPKY